MHVGLHLLYLIHLTYIFPPASTIGVLDADVAVNVNEEASAKEQCENGTVVGGITPPSTTPPPQEDKAIRINCHWTKTLQNYENKPNRRIHQ